MDNTTQKDQDYKKTVFVDMDGCIADFEGYFKTITGMTVQQVTDPELWTRIDAYGKSKFFSELPWTMGGKDLWTFVTNNFLQVKILSALGKSDLIDKQTSQGKMVWLKKNIPSLPNEDIILVQNKHLKAKYCKPGDIIIDDTAEVIQEWTRKQGIGILHRTSQETIAKLRQYV